MKIKFLLPAIMLASVLLSCSQAFSAAPGNMSRKDTLEDKIWSMEEVYFTCLYKADYEGVLALVHDRYLGWPGGLAKPIGKEESAQFMKKLVPKPTTCTIRIEREGIRIIENVALTEYILHVTCSETAGVTKMSSSRITHTWVKEGASWKLLGGMSFDK